MDRLLDLFAGILESPDMNLAAQVQECQRCAAAVGVPVEGLREFESFVAGASREQLATLYGQETSLIGRQLYGDGYGRSMFLMDLQKRYRRNGFETGDEPADHLAVMLRFLSSCDDPAERRELLSEILIPALESTLAGGTEETPSAVTPFAPLLRALSAALKEEREELGAGA